MEQGGELEVKGAGCVPRNRRQISSARRKTQPKDANPLYSVMLECTLQQGKSAGFVKDVKAAPQPMCVLSFDWQLNDMERFLTHNHSFGVALVDTTFNLGDFYVTAITYPHLMLEDIRTRKSPQLLGAIHVHQIVNFSSCNYFSSTPIGCHPNLRNLMAFGSDGDKSFDTSIWS